MAWSGVAFCVALALVGCSATANVVDYSDMKTDVRMDRTVFLQPLNKFPKKVFVEIKHTTNRPDLIGGFQPVLVGMIQSRGYEIVMNPNQADYLIQSNIRYIGEYNDAVVRDGMFTGAAVGALSGLAIAHSAAGVAGGALVGGAIGLAADVATRTKTCIILIDVRLTERALARPLAHDCGVAASATKIWLTTEAAAPTLVQLAAQQISGIF